MSSEPTMVTLPGGQKFDLTKLNSALDVVVDVGEAAGRYALVHTHGWPATEAVDYARAAQRCIDDSIDPNDLTA